jgi:acyl-coenzyme A thioesterase PaaI-like protein
VAIAGLAGEAGAARRGGKLDPVGAWSCVVYGHPAFGDERVLLNFAPSGTAQQARQDDDKISAWIPLTAWTVDDGELTFRDSRTGRQYRADLRRDTLGGSWRTLTMIGGWWCSAMDTAAVPAIQTRAPAEIMPPLVPSLTATPSYPVQAIRAAKQGRAVTCFFVDASGRVVQPELIELSDEVFREPILEALERSRYRGWDDPKVLRPGCRSYIFRLDALNIQFVTP